MIVGVSPNPNYFNSNPQIHKDRLEKIKLLIARTQGVYTSEQFKEVRQQYEANMCQKQDDEEAAKKEHEKNLRDKEKAEADKIYKNQMEGIRNIKKSNKSCSYFVLLMESLEILLVSFRAYFMSVVRSAAFSLSFELRI